MHDHGPPSRLKERLGAFIHHPLTSLVVVTLIIVSVGLVAAHLILPQEDPRQTPIEDVQILITVLFVLELSIKAYVAPDRTRFLGQYWIDIVAVIPWVQSLRVLRVLRLLRVFRVALILTRRVRFVSSLFRSAVGEYVVLGMIMILLLGIGTFTLYVSETRAVHRDLRRVESDVASLEVRVGLASPAEGSVPDPHAPVPTAKELLVRLDAVRTRAALQGRQEVVEQALAAQARPVLARKLPEGTDLAQFENSFWATLFFLVATEPMIDVPRTTAGRVIVLLVMFGGLTTFAIFTGIVTALMVNRLKRRMEIDDMDRYQLNDHTIICGWNRLVPLIIREITQTRGRDSPALVVLADLEEPPQEITDLESAAKVFFVRGDYTKPECLEQARVRQARTGIIVADTTIPRSDQDRDARTVLSALMMERMQEDIYTCAELLNRENEVHLRAAGVEEVIVTSEAGGHHLALAALHAGLADVLNELVTARHGDTLIKSPVPPDYAGLSFLEAIEHCKRDRDALLIGLEVHGQDGPKSEGYQMIVNPPETRILGERDNLVLIAAHPETP